jgi:hypothetical protein
MTQVTIEQALQTMLIAAEDLIEMIYQYQHRRADAVFMRHQHAMLQGAFETIAHACAYPLGVQQNWSDEAYAAAENYWGQYDEDGITIVYADGAMMHF